MSGWPTAESLTPPIDGAVKSIRTLLVGEKTSVLGPYRFMDEVSIA
jgi:hypothetical protein